MIAEPIGTEYGTSAHTVTARRPYRCEGDTGYRCRNTIQPGDEYVRATAFPGCDANGSDRPWHLKLCRECATKYGRPMPARRGKVSTDV